MSDQKILINPQMASNFAGELEGLANSLRMALPEFDVEVRDPSTAPPGAFGPDLGEVLTVILPIAENYIITAVLDTIADKLRGTWRRRNDDAPVKRLAQIYGPNGEVLAAVEVDDSDPETAEN